MNATSAKPPVVAIVGGGFTGAAVSYHLASTLLPGQADIVVVEPRVTLGLGLAYSAPNPVHRINVPAAKMSLLPGTPSHFADWLHATLATEDDPDATTPTGQVFPRRALFGRYVSDQLAPLIAAGTIGHRRAQVVDIRQAGEGFRLILDNGNPLLADIVVLAASHPLPAAPSVLKSLIAAPGFISNVYQEQAFDGLDTDARVLIVGNGLTAADTVAALAARGHHGQILSLSRRGLRSRGHAISVNDPRGNFSDRPAGSALELLERTRKELARASAEGMEWHPVLDALRQQGNAIWSQLALIERSRLVRHLRVFWDVHRFRVAPQVDAAIEKYFLQGKLRIAAGSLQHAVRRDGHFEIGIRLRGSRETTTHVFDAIAIATGPAHSAAIHDNPAYLSLFTQGLLRPDPLGLGLHTTTEGRAIGAEGLPVERLFVAGPLARASVGELMGLPEVTQHGVFIAEKIRQEISSSA